MKIKDYYNELTTSFIEESFVKNGEEVPDWFVDLYNPDFLTYDSNYLNIIFGEYETLAPTKELIRNHVKCSCLSNRYKFKTLYETIIQDYNPIENYDKYEQITTTYNGSESTTNHGTNTVEFKGKESTNTTHTGTDTKSHSGSDSITKAGSDSTTRTGTDTTNYSGSETTTNTKSGQEKNSKLGTETTTDSAAIFNLSSAELNKSTTNYGSAQPIVEEVDFINREDSSSIEYDNRRDSITHDTTDTTTTSGTDTTSYNSEESNVVDLTDSTSMEYTNRSDDTTTDSTSTRSFNDRQDIVLNRTHGNIGVTTAEQMLTAQRKLANYNFIQEVYSTIINDIAFLYEGGY